MARNTAGTYAKPGNSFDTPVFGTTIDPTHALAVWTDLVAALTDSLAHSSGATVTDVASAATCDIGASATAFVRVTGTTGITSFGSGANKLRFVRFAGALTLTHNATTLILPGGLSITTAAGDCALVASDDTGNWRVYHYQALAAKPINLAGTQGDIIYRNATAWVALGAGTNGFFLKTLGAGANPAWAALTGGGDLLAANNLSDVASAATAFGNIKQAASDTATGAIEIAVQSEMEAGTDTVRAVVPGRQHFHPSASKCWGFCTVAAGVPTLRDSYNVTSITDTATGRLTVTIGNDISSAFYATAVDGSPVATNLEVTWTISKAAGSFEVRHADSGGTLADPLDWSFIVFGDL